MSESFAKKLDLDETGRRYDHYMELKECFLLGIEVLDEMRKRYKSPTDETMRIKLSNAVEMIEKYIGHLCNYDVEMASYGDIAKEVRKAGVHVTPLLKGETDVKQPTQDSNRTSTGEDSGGETANA